MTTRENEAFHELLPDRAEIENAKRICRIAAPPDGEGTSASLSLALGGDNDRTVMLEPALAESVLDVLELVSNGRGFQVIPLGDELTTRQAADFLNVPLGYLEEILERGEIPFAESDGHRRVRADDLSAYKRKRDAKRSKSLGRLARWVRSKVYCEKSIQEVYGAS